MVNYQSKGKNYSRVRKDSAEKPSLNPKGSLAKIIDLSKHAQKVLDIGCADGSLGQYLKEFGCHVTGIDVNTDMIKIAEQYCDEVHVVDLDQSNISDVLSPKSFEVIVCGDVLEHLKDPKKILLQLKSLLTDTGFMIASIPNIAHGAIRLSLLQGKFDYQEFGILDNTHLRFFTRTSVISLFENAGYDAQIVDITQCSIFGGNLVPLIDRSMFSEKLIKQIEASSDSTVLQFIVKAAPNIASLPHSNIDQEIVEYQEQYSEIYSDSSVLKSELENLRGTPENQLQEAKAQLQETKTQLQETKAQLQETKTQLQETAIELYERKTEYNKIQVQLKDSLILRNSSQKELENEQTQRKNAEDKLASAQLIIEEIQGTMSWKLQKKIDELKEWIRGSKNS